MWTATWKGKVRRAMGQIHASRTNSIQQIGWLRQVGWRLFPCCIALWFNNNCHDVLLHQKCSSFLISTSISPVVFAPQIIELSLLESCFCISYNIPVPYVCPIPGYMGCTSGLLHLNKCSLFDFEVNFDFSIQLQLSLKPNLVLLYKCFDGGCHVFCILTFTMLMLIGSEALWSICVKPYENTILLTVFL